MSQAAKPDEQLASHTLAYLRRIDRRQNEMVDLFVRQQELISRLDRDMREGFTEIQRDIAGLRTDLANLRRDVHEVRSDIVLLENNVLNRVNAEYDLSSRITQIEERQLDLPEAATAPDDESGTQP
ncbi:hypothetical protein [Antarcticirhabdus aurantiaca]|uniref:Uncharacterized protein n=1 Tax=Antarcticirhabdus aurantiaca TaxID=2606717 RepID=A0ACD4NVR1_9HYPH|nr:hypothetical protein [Antarcticirhabdus aurantiaca]WAJ30694.1 hypothetical protein OXU80_11015 [Jeongeuplla avenae]